MPKFIVTMRETHIVVCDYEVDADSEAEAERMGQQMAPGEEVFIGDPDVVDWEFVRVTAADDD